MSNHLVVSDPSAISSRFSESNAIGWDEDFDIDDVIDNNLIAAPYDDDDQDDQNFDYQSIEKHLSRIPAREADLITLYYHNRMKQEQIAKVFSTTQAAISYRINRGIKRIRFLKTIPDLDYDLMIKELSPHFNNQDLEILWRMNITTCQSEIAKQLNLTQGRVRHRFIRARDKIRDLIKKELQEKHYEYKLLRDKKYMTEEEYEKKKQELNDKVGESIYSKYYIVFNTISDRNYNILHEVSLPQFKDRSDPTITLMSDSDITLMNDLFQMNSFVSGGKFSFEFDSIGGTWRWTVGSKNVRNYEQFFEVDDITSPFGKLSDVSIPIPGDVIDKICESINNYREQLSPTLSIVNPQVFSVTVTECDPVISVGEVIIMNTGAFGSFLSASAVPNSSWIIPSPSVVKGIQKDSTGSFDVSINPSLLFSSSSPYSGVLNIQDNRNPNISFPVTVNVVVLPRPVIYVSSQSVTFVFNSTDCTSNSPQTVDVCNTGPNGSLLNFEVVKVSGCRPWLIINPINVGPLGSGDSQVITFSIDSSYVSTTIGTYVETVLIRSPNAINNPTAIVVTLVVSLKF